MRASARVQGLCRFPRGCARVGPRHGESAPACAATAGMPLPVSLTASWKHSGVSRTETAIRLLDKSVSLHDEQLAVVPGRLASAHDGLGLRAKHVPDLAPDLRRAGSHRSRMALAEHRDVDGADQCAGFAASAHHTQCSARILSDRIVHCNRCPWPRRRHKLRPRRARRAILDSLAGVLDPGFTITPVQVVLADSIWAVCPALPRGSRRSTGCAKPRSWQGNQGHSYRESITPCARRD